MKHLFLILILFLFGCSSYKLSNREGKDFKLTKNNLEELNGYYSNTPIDSLLYSKNFFEHFHYDTVSDSELFNFRIRVIDKKTLKIELFEAGIVVDSLSVKGGFSKGYFKINKEFDTEFVLGPIIWALGDDVKYIGLTKSKDVVLLNAYGGVIFLVIMPLRGAETSSVNIYKKLK